MLERVGVREVRPSPEVAARPRSSRDRETLVGMTGSQWPTPEQVLAALDASGHLLEQQVATELEGLGYHTQTNRAYTDSEEGKSRELDVYAYKSLMQVQDRRLRVGMYLLIECKKTAAPFAFLTRPLPPLHRPPEEVVITLHSHEEQFERDGQTLIHRIPTFNTLGLHKAYWGTADPVKAVHISRLDRKGGNWQATNTGVYDSLTWPMAKALRAFKAPFRNPNRGFDARTDHSLVLFFIPIVVVASKLYVVDGTSPSPQAHEVDHVRFQREIKAKGFGGDFALDFVQKDGLIRFVEETVVPFGARVVEVVEADIDAVIPKDKWPMWTDW